MPVQAEIQLSHHGPPAQRPAAGLRRVRADGRVGIHSGQGQRHTDAGFRRLGNPSSNHYAFLASDEEFDAILQRIKDEEVVFGSGPRSRTDGEINYNRGGLGFYFECESGHVWEVIMQTYNTN